VTESPSDEISSAFRPLLADPSRAGVFTDFDGTLAPIVEDPSTAVPLEGAVDALAAVARRVARAGVISGRPGAFLLRHLRDAPVSLWGLYGLERVAQEEGGGERRVIPSPEAEEWRESVDEAANRFEEEVGDQLDVERKGLTVVLHFRQAQELEDLARETAEATAEATGLSLHPGRMSFELRPPVTGDKGTALQEAASGLAAACFFGDDTGDLEAFDALDRLGRDEGMATVKVGVRSEEAPPELLERADLVVDGPPGVLEILRLLAEEQEEEGES
jgi:trehalose 6-phosphate phosphatase